MKCDVDGELWELFYCFIIMISKARAPRTTTTIRLATDVKQTGQAGLNENFNSFYCPRGEPSFYVLRGN